MECGGVLWSLVRSDEGRSKERGEKKRNIDLHEALGTLRVLALHLSVCC